VSLAFALTLLGLVGCSANYGKVEESSSQLAFGVAMARRGLWSEATFRFEQARRQDPTNPRVLNNLAVSAEALGRFDQAQKSYQEALRLAPGDPEIKRNYARFIEFYQAFNAGKQEGDSATEPGKAPPGTATPK
jgi:type IV pilus assembly protein PilF